MPIDPSQVVTVVLRRDGRLHLAREGLPRADAERWAEEGYHVFVLAARGAKWAVNHVNSGGILTDAEFARAGPQGAAAVPDLLQLTSKGE